MKTGRKRQERIREGGDRQEKSAGSEGQRIGLRGADGGERKNRK